MRESWAIGLPSHFKIPSHCALEHCEWYVWGCSVCFVPDISTSSLAVGIKCCSLTMSLHHHHRLIIISCPADRRRLYCISISLDPTFFWSFSRRFLYLTMLLSYLWSFWLSFLLFCQQFHDASWYVRRLSVFFGLSANPFCCIHDFYHIYYLPKCLCHLWSTFFPWFCDQCWIVSIVIFETLKLLYFWILNQGEVDENSRTMYGYVEGKYVLQQVALLSYSIHKEKESCSRKWHRSRQQYIV